MVLIRAKKSNSELGGLGGDPMVHGHFEIILNFCASTFIGHFFDKSIHSFTTSANGFLLWEKLKS